MQGWDVMMGPDLAARPGAAGVNSVAFSPEGRALAAAGGEPGRPGGVILWDVDTRTPRVVLRGHTQEVSSVLFSADGGTLATASPDGTVRLWDPDTAAARSALAPGIGALRAVAFSPDGLTLVAAGTAGTIAVVDTE